MDPWIKELADIWAYGFLPASVALLFFSIEVVKKYYKSCLKERGYKFSN